MVYMDTMNALLAELIQLITAKLPMNLAFF